MKKQRVVIIGGGPAGLMVATQLIHSELEVIVVEQKPTVGRKFLVAGEGGFNLTHSEDLISFSQRYDSPYIQSCVEQFTPTEFQSWLAEIGIPTFVGSSGKVFPEKGIKPVAVLKAWTNSLKKGGTTFQTSTTCIAFNKKEVSLVSKKVEEKLTYDYLVFACGGASWKKTGSDGKWTQLFDENKIATLPFVASNSGIELVSSEWLTKNEGEIIKNIRLTAGENTYAGDIVVTNYGLEGKPVYASNNWLREHPEKGIFIDFKPQLSVDQLISFFYNSKTVKTGFVKANISLCVYDWFKETLSKEVFTDAVQLAKLIKNYSTVDTSGNSIVKGFRPIDEVISTVGGLSMESINEHGLIKGYKNVYACGEMLDWDAPTGGYLLQGCVSSGFVVGSDIRQRGIQ